MFQEGDKICGISKPEAERYSRQLLVPEVGVAGQKNIGSKSVLVVGAGGLGSPAALYLAGAGVKRLGLMDGDNVESSNLHRQVIHSESRVGVSKAESGAIACRGLNSNVEVEVIKEFLSTSNALSIVKRFDIVLDASDNVETRYMVNDACILAGKPLISGSALRLEGQLTVYGYQGGPCYRCIFPKPPPADTVTSCADGGVLGPVPGVIGTLQAMEALKVAMEMGKESVLSGRMLLYDAATCRFRNISLRGRDAKCGVCGEEPTVTAVESVLEGGARCAEESAEGGPALPAGKTVSAAEYAAVRRGGTAHALIDVREQLQFDICHLPGAVNVPVQRVAQSAGELAAACAGKEEVFVLCRRGIFSRDAAREILEMAAGGKFEEGTALAEALPCLPLTTLCGGAEGKVKHIEGGLQSWARHVDESFPVY